MLGSYFTTVGVVYVTFKTRVYDEVIHLHYSVSV